VALGAFCGVVFSGRLPGGRPIGDPILVLSSHGGEYVIEECGLLGLAVLLFLSGAGITRWPNGRMRMKLLRYVYRASRGATSEYDLLLYEDRLISHSIFGSQTLSWSMITDLVRERDLWFLVSDKTSFYGIPDHLLGNRAAFQAFVE
jgi:hypothetical protein